MMHYTTTVTTDAQDNYIITIPDQILNYLEWKEGDTLNWQISDSKQIIITKIKNAEESGGEDQESNISEATEEDWEDFWYNSESEGKDYDQRYDEDLSEGRLHPRQRRNLRCQPRNLRSSVPLARTARIGVKHTRSKDIKLFPVNCMPWRLEPRTGKFNLSWYMCFDHAVDQIERQNLSPRDYKLQCYVSVPLTDPLTGSVRIQRYVRQSRPSMTLDE